MSQNNDNEKLHVKLYVLNDEGSWDDRGPGYLSLYSIEDQDNGPCSYKIIITDNNEVETLLESELNPQNNYQRQENTLIAWQEDGKELAISFKEESHCDIAFDIITKTLNLAKMEIEGSLNENQDDINDGVQTSTEYNCSKFENIDESFPNFDYEHLSDVAAFFLDAANSPIKRNQLAELLESRNLIPVIIKQFHICEDLNDMTGLHNIHNIVKVIFTFSKFSIYETILSDENILDIIGILEYNPSVTEHVNHRKFLETAVYKELIPYSNKAIKDLIIHTYRLQYIHEALLPLPTVFDGPGSVLTSFIFFRKNEIVESILEDEQFLDEFFRAIVDDEIDDDTRRKLSAFLAELTSISKVLQTEKREVLLSKLIKYDIISLSLRLLNLNDISIKNSIIEALNRIIENHPILIRQNLVASPEKNSALFVILWDEFIKFPESNTGLFAWQIVRYSIDVSNMTKEMFGKSQSSEFFTVFYSCCINHIMSALFSYTSGNCLKDETHSKALSIEYIVELFIVCLEFHSSHIKNYVIRSDIFRNIIILLESKYAFLAHVAVKVLRRTINLADDFYNRYLIRENILDYLIVSLKKNHKRYDIVNSAILDIFEYIKTVDARILIVSLVERHREFFLSTRYCTTFEKLVTAYDNISNENILPKSSRFGRVSGRFKQFEIPDKIDENSWIEEDDSKETSFGPLPDVIEAESSETNTEMRLDQNESLNDENNLNHSHEINLPPIKAKKENEEDFISLNSFNPVSQTPSIKICFKSNISSNKLVKRNNKDVDPTSVPVSASTRLVDYPDDDDDCNLPPCDDYIIEDIIDADIPANKKSKIIDSL